MRELGHGGMAHVYLAIQESFGREVALKVLSPHLADDEQFSKRFLREARIVSQLNHPNIVTVYDAGKAGKYHYMSMEYIPGKDVKHLKDNLPRKEALRIVKDVARALDFAGSKGVVHRDIKPENIMIHQGDRRVVLMDFGIAHGDDVTQGMTQTGKAIGTPHFMSPEQTKGLKVDHRSDIYSLGIVMFQLLAGYLPYDADSAVAVGIKHLTAPIPLLPAGLEIFQPIINRCLSKEPQHRYQKAADLIADLDKISDEQLENIDTRAKVVRQASADPEAATQLSDATAVVSHPRKVPELVFPTNKAPNYPSGEENIPKSHGRRNFLLLLLVLSIGWAAYDRQQQIIHFWGYKAVPKLAKKFPNLLPKDYVAYWTQKAEKHRALKQAESNPTLPPAAEVKPAESTANIKTPLTGNETAVTEVATPAEPEPQLPMNRAEKIEYLTAQLDEKPENALELAQIYKAMLRESDQPVKARRGLKQLRDWYSKQIRLSFADEDAEMARRYIALMKQSFPRASKTPRFRRLEKKVAFLERLENHFELAEKYFNAGALSKPLGRNALAEINKVLRLSPNNERAKAFIDKITQAYLDETTELQQQGNLHNALLMVEEGIAAMDNDPRLLTRRVEIREQIQRNKEIEKLFRQAQQYQHKGQLIRPQAYSAYDSYHKILELDTNNLQAKAALKTIHQLVAKDITHLIQNDELKKAESYLQLAQQRYGKTPLLGQVQLKLHDALEAIAPKITLSRLSAKPVTTLVVTNASNPNSLKLRNTLYAGFSYTNFNPGTSWLDAYIIDEKNQARLTQKPVVISGQSGEHFFSIQLNNRYFKNGRYRLLVKLKKRILLDRGFEVRR